MDQDILERILSELKDIKNGQVKIEKRLDGIDNRLDNVERKLDSVFEYTGKVIEDIKNINVKIDKVYDDVDFIKYKEHQTEEDLFKLKKNLKIIK